MMKLSDADILRLLPEFMRKDGAVIGLATAINELIKEPGARVKTARVWDKIDELTDAELDELAYELDIDWYSKTLPIENKRALIKSADLIHSRRGTKWAVEQVLIDIFGSGTVIEWYDYNGDPFHFRVSTDYPLENQDIIERFRAAIAVAKPCRAVLDSIEFAHTGSTGAFSAAAGIGVELQASGVAINI
ncbi:MAG: phage tail protein I [Lachnospiraceae bacterium]|nr:phage tail protein I [Lachnospiraceae bacterium]